ncbi:MAG: hypothetical protein MAG795_01045 [Candidatus Woesearchaeota archaeon]|nr:hypothetical protein [Candidatus Woesearchaeota archaeon]
MEENKETKKGVAAIVYDNRGSNYYFLILRRANSRKEFEFIKGKMGLDEEPIDAVSRVVREKVGLKNFEVKGNLVLEWNLVDNLDKFTIFLIEANMNVVVDISNSPDYDNYLWTAKENVASKLILKQEMAAFSQALKIFDSGQLK